MNINIDNVAKDIYSILSATYNVEIFNSEGTRVYNYIDARNFYCTPGKILVSLVNNNDKYIINVKLNNNIDLEKFENVTGLRLRKVASRYPDVSYTIRTYAKQISKKEENTMLHTDMSEGMYGTTRSSYQKIGECKVIIRHIGKVNEEKHGSRSRHISSIFVETKNGERFKIAENNLHGARAMARHLSNGGSPFDTVGMKVTTMMSEMNELKGMILEARKISKQVSLTEENNILIEQMRTKFLTLRESLKRMSGKVGYLHTTSSLTESDLMNSSYKTYVIDDGVKQQVGVDYIYNNRNNDALQFEVNNYNNDKKYYGEEVISEYNTAYNDIQKLSTPWEDKKAWATAVLQFINKRIKLSSVRKPQYKHTQASALKLLNLNDADRQEFFNIITKNNIKEEKTNALAFVSPLQRLALKMSDALKNPKKYNLSGAFLPIPGSDEKITADMNNRFNRMSRVIYKLENDDMLTPDEYELALKFHNLTKNTNIDINTNDIVEATELSIPLTKQTNSNSIKTSITTANVDSANQIQDSASFSRDKQQKGNYADANNLLSASDIKESKILEDWFNNAAMTQFKNILPDNTKQIIENKSTVFNAIQRLTLNIGKPAFNTLIAVYEAQGILEDTINLLEQDSKLYNNIIKSRISLYEFHNPENITDAYNMVNELVSTHKMGTKDAIHLAATKYAKEHHNNSEHSYNQISDVLRQMAVDKGVIHADAGRTFADDVMSTDSEIESNKKEISAEEYYGDSNFGNIDETMSSNQLKTRENIITGLKKNIPEFKKRYGKRWKDVMYATATKQAMSENVTNIVRLRELSGIKEMEDEVVVDMPINQSNKYDYHRLIELVKPLLITHSMESAFNTIANERVIARTGDLPPEYVKQRTLDLLRIAYDNGAFDSILSETECSTFSKINKSCGKDNKEEFDKDVSGPYVGEDELHSTRLFEPDQQTELDEYNKNVTRYKKNDDMDVNDYNSKYSKKQQYRKLRQKKEYDKNTDIDI